MAVGSYDPTVTAYWGDAEHTFRLKAKQIFELQEKTGSGIYAVYRRVMSGDWKLEDVQHIIRLGLVGGGLKGIDAAKLVDRYFEPPYADHWQIAAQIIDATMTPPEDLEKKAEGAGAETQATSSAPQASTEQPASSD